MASDRSVTQSPQAPLSVPRVAEVWRFPVKSLRGERLSEAILDARGVVHDRRWALVDSEGKIASGKSTKRFRKLAGLMHHASHVDGELPVITLEDGRRARADDPALAELLAEIAPGWELREEGETAHMDAAAVHLVTSTTLATLSDLVGEEVPVQRLRPNLLITGTFTEPFPEDAWVGRTLAIGEVRLEVRARTERCVMTTQSQTGLAYQPAVLKQIGRVNQANAGVYAKVLTPGRIREGDTVEVI